VARVVTIEQVRLIFWFIAFSERAFIFFFEGDRCSLSFIGLGNAIFLCFYL
jgi:hypothetical protein